MTLIERLEHAETGSRESDAEIAKAIYPKLELRGNGQWYIDNIHVRIEPYTTSIDAALTLVPEDMGWHSWCDDRKATMTVGDVGFDWGPHIMPEGYGEADTPALALCIAALKAREQNDDPH